VLLRTFTLLVVLRLRYVAVCWFGLRVGLPFVAAPHGCLPHTFIRFDLRCCHFTYTRLVTRLIYHVALVARGWLRLRFVYVAFHARCWLRFTFVCVRLLHVRLVITVRFCSVGYVRVAGYFTRLRLPYALVTRGYVYVVVVVPVGVTPRLWITVVCVVPHTYVRLRGCCPVTFGAAFAFVTLYVPVAHVYWCRYRICVTLARTFGYGCACSTHVLRLRVLHVWFTVWLRIPCVAHYPRWLRLPCPALRSLVPVVAVTFVGCSVWLRAFGFDFTVVYVTLHVCFAFTRLRFAFTLHVCSGYVTLDPLLRSVTLLRC